MWLANVSLSLPLMIPIGRFAWGCPAHQLYGQAVRFLPTCPFGIVFGPLESVMQTSKASPQCHHTEAAITGVSAVSASFFALRVHCCPPARREVIGARVACDSSTKTKELSRAPICKRKRIYRHLTLHGNHSISATRPHNETHPFW
jgi:hypothetical protein